VQSPLVQIYSMSYLSYLNSLPTLNANTGQLFARSMLTSIKPRTFVSPLAPILLQYLDFLTLMECLLLTDTLYLATSLLLMEEPYHGLPNVKNSSPFPLLKPNTPLSPMQPRKRSGCKILSRKFLQSQHHPFSTSF